MSDAPQLRPNVGTSADAPARVRAPRSGSCQIPRTKNSLVFFSLAVCLKKRITQLRRRGFKLIKLVGAGAGMSIFIGLLLPAVFFNNVQVNPPDTTILDTQTNSDIVVDGPNVFITYLDTSKFRGSNSLFISFSKSTDGGLTFTQVPLPVPVLGSFGQPSLDINRLTRTLYLVDGTPGSPISGLTIYRSDDLGNTWSTGIAVPGPGGQQLVNPSVVVDNFPGPGQGNVHLAYRDYDFTGIGGGGIRFTSSTNGGITFGASQLLAPGGNFPTNDVNGPQVTIGPEHNLYVFYYDLVQIPFAFLLAAASCRADVILYRISMDTSALVGNPAGPFALNFQLNSGGRSSATTQPCSAILNSAAVPRAFQHWWEERAETWPLA